ncbi:MAG: hypothetical protein ACJ8CB_34575 [Ktedonobacteraceae bacterium]
MNDTQSAQHDDLQPMSLRKRKSPHAALRAIVEYLASLYQQQRASFLLRYVE